MPEERLGAFVEQNVVKTIKAHQLPQQHTDDNALVALVRSSLEQLSVDQVSATFGFAGDVLYLLEIWLWYYKITEYYQLTKFILI